MGVVLGAGDGVALVYLHGWAYETALPTKALLRLEADA